MSAPAKTAPKPQAKAAPKGAAPQVAAVPASASSGKGKILIAAVGLSGIGAALAVYALPLFILVYGGLMPTLVAYLMDERRGKHFVITIAAMNGAGVVLALRPLFSSGFMSEAGFVAVANPSNWMMIFGFAMAGWFLAWAVPVAVSHVLDLLYRQRQRAAEVQREAIVAQWPGIIGPAARDDNEEPTEAPKAVSRAAAAPRPTSG